MEAVEDEEICFTKERFCEGETDRIYYKNSRDDEIKDVKEFDNSPQFTGRQNHYENAFV